MRVWQTVPGTPCCPSRASRRALRDSRFALPGEDEDAASVPVQAPAVSIASPVLASLSAPVEASPANAAACVQAADDVLGALQSLQLAALGSGGAQARQVLAGLCSPPRSGNAALDGVLQAIAQRAAVELARP